MENAAPEDTQDIKKANFLHTTKGFVQSLTTNRTVAGSYLSVCKEFSLS